MIFKQPLKGVPNNDSNRRDKNESLTHGGQDNIGPLLFIHIMHKKHTQETQLPFSRCHCILTETPTPEDIIALWKNIDTLSHNDDQMIRCLGLERDRRVGVTRTGA